MKAAAEFEDQAALVLAAEDCEPDRFEQLHKFSPNEERLLTKLMAHGPVLLRGGRGSGKSALMIEASRRLAPLTSEGVASGLYLSLRHLKLLRSKEEAYEKYLCELICDRVRTVFGESASEFSNIPEASALGRELSALSSRLGKRIVIFFDDAAHLGREASLTDFFDVFRTISSSTVSCKAAIYPGVTRFGMRFDVYNDATVLDVAKSEELPGFEELFLDVMRARYPAAFPEALFSRTLDKQTVAGVLARAVLGNMRAFVFACNTLKERSAGKPVGLPEVGDSLLSLSQNYYWPLLDEIKPKLGMYEPMIEPAAQAGNILFETCGAKPGNPRSALLHRDVVERISKPMEMLEYAGFVSKREASRGMKSGGRGARFALNLCNLFERTPGTRLTRELLDRWRERDEPIEFHKTSKLSEIALPTLDDAAELGILKEPIETLAQSKIYPYGLTNNKLAVLRSAGIDTVGSLATAEDAELLALQGVGAAALLRFRNVVGQAIWM